MRLRDLMPRKVLLRAAFFFLLFFALQPLTASAQRGEVVDYYVSPYWHAIAIDPLGIILGRLDGMYEYRVDPLISRYFDLAYHTNLNKVKNGIITRSIAGSFGERIYLKDNAAIVGFYAGVNLGPALINFNALAIKLTLELGYKISFGSNKQFFIEPKGMIDAFIFHKDNMSEIYPYIAIPIGYTW